MAGHSKWANIQHRKGVQDKRRGKIFTKLIREITVAAKIGGADLDANSRLRLAVDKAYDQNMPKDTIERAIKRAAGGHDNENFEHVRYEGYGPGGVAVMVDCLTDNRNRTVSEVRHAFTKMGGNLGTDGSVSYLFTKSGVLSFAPGTNEDQIMEAALDAGASDVVTNDDRSIDVITEPDELATVKETIIAKGLQPAAAEVAMRASTYVALAPDDAETMVKLLDMLEDLDDVQQVYSNADISEEILAQFS